MFAWLKNPLRMDSPLNGRQALMVLAAGAASALILKFAGTIDDAEDQLARPAEYSVRYAADKGPELNQRIKLVVWDDATVSHMSQRYRTNPYDVPIITWARLFELMAEQGPRFVWVDRVFETPLGTRQYGAEFVERMQALSTPIFGSAYVSKHLKHTPPPVHLSSRPQYKFPEGLKGASWWQGCADNPQHLYGPNHRILPGLGTPGHINLEGQQVVDLFRCLDENHAVPYWLLTAFWDELEFKDGKVYANGKRIPVNSRGQIPVNLMDRYRLIDSSISISEVFKAAQNYHPLDFIGPDDIVIILPMFYTGNADFKDTALGPTVGGLLHAMVLNSFLNNDWIYPVGGDYGFMLVGVLFAMIAGMMLSFTGFWSTFVAVTLVTILGSIAMFTAWSITIPWMHFLIPFTITGTLASAQRQWVLLTSNLVMQKDLEMGQAVQTILLPEYTSGVIGPWKFEVAFRPYGPMSGDWLQIYVNPDPQPGETLGAIAIGDVVGKGPSAALNTAVIASVWRDITERQKDFSAEQFVSELDRIIKLTFRGEQNTTISLALFYPEHVTVTSYGAPSWLHIKPEEGKAPGIVIPKQNPLGIAAKMRKFGSKDVPVANGEILAAYTDGVMDGLRAVAEFRKRFKRHCKDSEFKGFSDVMTLLEDMTSQHALPDDFTAIFIGRRSKEIAEAKPLKSEDAA